MAGATEVDSADPNARSAASRVRPQLAQSLATEPGMGLLAALMDLMTRPGELTAREQLEAVAAWDRMVGFCQAGKLTAVQDLDAALHPAEPDPGREQVPATANELAPVLRIAPRTASTLVGQARRCRDLPAAVDALADGDLTLSQLEVLDQVVRHLPPELRGRVEAEAVRCGPTRTRQQLHAHLTSTAAELDPGYASNAAAQGVRERDVQLRTSPLPGCHRLVADLPTLDAYAVWHAINGAAKRAKGTGGRPDRTDEDRSLSELRADLLTARMTGIADSGNPDLVPTPEVLTRLAQVQVVVAADTLTGAGDLPAHLPGAGPIDPATVRDLAARVPWRRLVADPDTGTLVHRDRHLMPPPDARRHTAAGRAAGADAVEGLRDSEAGATDPRLEHLVTDPVAVAPLDVGISRYRPPAYLRDHVHTRDANCIGPACHHSSAGTQIDHTTNFAQTDANGRVGVTADHNLGSPCIRWHNAKTHGGWQLQQPRPGHFIWTSPLGRTYTRAARPLVPGWRSRRQRPPPASGT